MPASARTSSSPACGTGSRSGTARPGAASSRRSKGAPSLLPNALPTRGREPHVPVLAGEVRELLAVRPGDTVVDCTFGAGGHARLLTADLQGDGRYLAIDRDPDALAFAASLRDELPAGVELRVL